jgi:hypothetical protein
VGDVEFVCAERQSSPAFALVVVNDQMGERHTSASDRVGEPTGSTHHNRRGPRAVGLTGDPGQCL